MGVDMNISKNILETLKLLLMTSSIPMNIENSIENSWINVDKHRALASI